MTIHFLSLASPLHDETFVNESAQSFLSSVEEKFDSLLTPTELPFDEDEPQVIYVTTGGVENQYAKLFPSSRRSVYLLTHCANNSLAAALEIAAFERERGTRVEVLHGKPEAVANRLKEIETIYFARSSLKAARLGVIGKPSDWLIGSTYSIEFAKDALGVELVEVGMIELISLLSSPPIGNREEDHPLYGELSELASDNERLEQAFSVYRALKHLAKTHRLDGLTLRCFDLVSDRKITACLALALLNKEGLLSGCEGDVPTLLSMALLRSLSGGNVFQANPAHIDEENNVVTLAHCTIPIDMPSEYVLNTHFESDLGLAIEGKLAPGPCTLFKMSGTKNEFFVADGVILQRPHDKRLCRTQVTVGLLDESVEYFLRGSIGNHHVLCPGHCADLVYEFLS